jgi:hypothetical protein
MRVERALAVGSLHMAATLVENNRWSVQRGTVVMASASAEVDIDFNVGGRQAFDKAKSFVRFTARLNSSVGFASLEQLGILSELGADNILRFRRGASGPAGPRPLH